MWEPGNSPSCRSQDRLLPRHQVSHSLGRLKIFLYPRFNSLPPFLHQDTENQLLVNRVSLAECRVWCNTVCPSSGRPKPLAAAFAEPLQGDAWPDPIRGPFGRAARGSVADRQSDPDRSRGFGHSYRPYSREPRYAVQTSPSPCSSVPPR